MIPEKLLYKYIEEICQEKGIELEVLSYGWIRKLTKNGKSGFIIGNKFGLNDEVSFLIARDKYATFEILKNNNIPIIEHKMIFSPTKRSQYYDESFIKEAERLAERHDGKIIIKANDSCEGKEVIYCQNIKEVRDTIKEMFDNDKETLSAQPFVNIDYEYRCVYLDGNIEYVYKKRKPYVTGDGQSTILKLIDKKYKDVPVTLNRELNLLDVPKQGEEVTISWKHNLYSGAEPIIIDETDPYYDQVIDIALRAAKAINVRFATVDVAQTHNREVRIMEINSSVSMVKFSTFVPNGDKIAKEIYGKAIDKLLE